MNKAILLLGSVCSCATVPSAAVQVLDGPTHSIGFYSGEATFDAPWETSGGADLSEHETFGFEYAATWLSGWGLELGQQTSEAEDISRVFETTELYAGVRRVFNYGASPVAPIIGLGATMYEGELTTEGSPVISESVVSPYAHVGLHWVTGANWSLGLDYRMIFDAELDFGGGEIESDYERLALNLAFSF